MQHVGRLLSLVLPGGLVDLLFHGFLSFGERRRSVSFRLAPFSKICPKKGLCVVQELKVHCGFCFLQVSCLWWLLRAPTCLDDTDKLIFCRQV